MQQVFLLYTRLSSGKSADGTSRFRGLGHIDSHEDTLTVTLKLGQPKTESRQEDESLASSPPPARNKSRRHAKSKGKMAKLDDETFDVEIVQDKTALRSRKGDTGSVLWRAR